MPLTSVPTLSNQWIQSALNRLTAPCGYHANEPPAAEPTALAALALLGAGQSANAQPLLQWLAAAQSAEGCIAPFSDVTLSDWTTALATFAAATALRQQADSNSAPSNSGTAAKLNFAQTTAGGFNLSQAQEWLLSAEGKKIENSPEFGHNGQLVGWPWVIGTHSWQEPTAWSVLALKALGLGNHPRTREGIRLLVDRLLLTGGCNYGNTVVLGQTLRPHVEPTGVALMALAGEQVDDPRIDLSLNYLRENVSADTTPISLSYGLLGLTAHNRRPAAADHWLEAVYNRTVSRGASPQPIALLVLAAQGIDCPLIKYTSAAKSA